MPPNERILEDAVDRWAARHPHPDEPAFLTGEAILFSPRQLAEAIRLRTRAGKQFLRVLERSAQRYSVEQVLSSFEKATGRR